MASVERNAKNVTATFAKTRKGKRVLEERAPKLEEDPKKILILQGNKVSQVVKDVLLDVNKLKKQYATKFTRKNEHSKKRPHNLVLGRLFNFQLLDMLELGIKSHKAISSFHGHTKVTAEHKPCFLFVGERFDAHPDFQLAKHLILDMFRGEVVDELNLMALDHVIACFAPDDKTLLFRQYCVCMKKSGTRIPRIELEPLGPHLDLELRRTWHAPADLSKEAHTHPTLGKKKQKNVDFEALEGKVGRIYMPKQDLGQVALAKSKGLKRDRRLAAAERKAKKRKDDNSGHAGDDGDMDVDDDVDDE